ncbi:hypothetical protein EVAR_39997_1 [Eumeta japonica]|uniref:Uncharacterized protein n=1 Tax=Eumeta variegata TaxID=151549 RepID=A0A4C1ZQJ8_EUMVA|nr:hypothetical protein EVAR_39997_1 [Eumeta japonica]
MEQVHVSRRLNQGGAAATKRARPSAGENTATKAEIDEPAGLGENKVNRERADTKLIWGKKPISGGRGKLNTRVEWKDCLHYSFEGLSLAGAPAPRPPAAR